MSSLRRTNTVLNGEIDPSSVLPDDDCRPVLCSVNWRRDYRQRIQDCAVEEGEIRPREAGAEDDRTAENRQSARAFVSADADIRMPAFGHVHYEIPVQNLRLATVAPLRSDDEVLNE